MNKNTSGALPPWGQWPAHPAERGHNDAQMRFVKRGDKFNWVHHLEMQATDVDCTGMTDDEFQAFVRTSEAAAQPLNDLHRIQADIDRAHAEEVRLGMHDVGSPA